MRFLSIFVLLALVVMVPNPALAWSQNGHEIVCDLAFRQLTPAARNLLFKVHDKKGPFYKSCHWADEVRYDNFKGTYNYHFLNVADGEDELDFARDCAALDCVTIAIQRYATILAREPQSSRDEENRGDALRFLAHFVADLHQPLHVSHRKDRGGNDITVTWLDTSNKRNLHGIWDTTILSESGARSVALAMPLLTRIQNMDVSMWRTFDIVGWTAETYQLAEMVAYTHENGTRVITGDNLPLPYFERARPIVEQQIMKASVRLAYLINQIAAGNLPRNMLVLNSPGNIDGRIRVE
ncbi:MAG: hypothetical protein O7E57_05070 [Gammaproteobacteria bacterium]|nr:hypothetical protein [Gammaproteobacteria bacterium]